MGAVRLFIVTLLLLCVCCSAQTTGNARQAGKTVKRIFNNFISYNQGTDSPANKAAMESALKELQNACPASLMPLLVNVWMYYDPTDFPARDLIAPVFFMKKDDALRAISKKLDHPGEHGNKDIAPLSDLLTLRRRLQEQ